MQMQIRYETDKIQNEKKVLADEVTSRTSEVQHLEQEVELMEAEAEMGLDDKHSIDFYLNQLNEQVQAKRLHLLMLQSEWDEEHSKLYLDLEKQPRLASRKSYVQRIKEITKNSRKQDADIERIFKETRDVQLESNSIQECLHRTHTVADEMVFRETKKDPIGRQVYRLLNSIHEGFEQLSEKILATDRFRREVAEYEMKLAAIASRSFDVDKLQILMTLLGKTIR